MVHSPLTKHHSMRASPKTGGYSLTYQTLRYLLVALLLTSLYPSAHGCVFPGFVQTNGTNQEWRGRIREQNKEPSLSVKIQTGTMTVESKDSSIRSFTRICVQAFGADKFLVAHEEEGQVGGRYTCMQLLQRGTGLVQLKVAPVNKRMDRSLCDDEQLLLDDWILLDMSRITESKETCALRGGYEMTIFDRSAYQGVCDGYKGETRIESECEHGEGLFFYFRQTTCVPDGLYMYTSQRVICVANWEADDLTFILLKHDKHPYMWIMRLSTQDITNNSPSFVAYVFKDLVAEMSDIIRSTENYLRLAMVRSAPQPVGSLCFDDYEICSELGDPCRYSDSMAVTCSKTCGVCNTTNPRLCTFKHDLQGRWLDASEPERDRVTINASSLVIDGRHKYQCIDWRTLIAPSDKNNAEEKMVVTTYSNGCRARYACARFIQKSPAAFFFQVSQSRRWPLVSSVSEKLSCENFEYEHESDGNGPKIRYRSRHMRMLVPKTANYTVTCDLEEFSHIEVSYKDSVRCSGELLQNESNGTKEYLRFSFPGCQVQRLRDTYSCVEFSTFAPANDRLLVTRNERNPYKVFCWIFPQRTPNMFYLVDASQCNEISKRRIRRGRLRPIATFEKRKIVLLTFHEEKVLNSSATVDYEADTSTAETIDVTETLTERNLTTASPTEGGTNPLVVTAVIITLMAFQIPFLCKCKSC